MCHVQECYSRPWLIASLAGGPVAIALYFHSGAGGLVFAALVGSCAAAAAYWTTCDPAFTDTPPDWDAGLGVPVGAVAVALAGFAIACMWIDTVCCFFCTPVPVSVRRQPCLLSTPAADIAVPACVLSGGLLSEICSMSRYERFCTSIPAVRQVASELVGLLQFFGVLAHISSLVLGLTLLAWGNSIPDLITDVAMARTG